MNFFFDLINHAAGYTDKYYDHHLTRHTPEQLVQKYRKDKIKYEGNLADSKLLGDRHPHCLLVLEGVQALYKMTTPDDLPQDYLDAMILRLQVSHFLKLNIVRPATWVNGIATTSL
jgi:hypothetical protein